MRLDELMPADHLLHHVDQLLDLAPLVAELRPYYASTGRPSIDPELMLRMLLVGYLYGVRSERRLVEEVRLNLAYRWFCGLALDAAVPHASMFSKNRHGRFRNAAVFRRVFERVVDLCLAAGHAPGQAVSVDGSFIVADASPMRRVDGNSVLFSWREAPDVQPHPVQAYFADLDTAAGLDAAGLAYEEQRDVPAFVPKHTSLTDPRAAWSRVKNVGCFAYKAHFLIDNAHGVILDAEGTDARLSHEIVAARSMLEHQRVERGITPGLLAADKSYGTGAFLAWLAGRGVEPMVPVLDRTHQTNGLFARDSFAYDPARSLRMPERARTASRQLQRPRADRPLPRPPERLLRLRTEAALHDRSGAQGRASLGRGGTRADSPAGGHAGVRRRGTGQAQGRGSVRADEAHGRAAPAQVARAGRRPRAGAPRRCSAQPQEPRQTLRGVAERRSVGHRTVLWQDQQKSQHVIRQFVRSPATPARLPYLRSFSAATDVFRHP